jgi:hypothetical protein
MHNSSRIAVRKRPVRATASTMADPAVEAVLEEVRQLRAAIAIYRKVVDRLLAKDVA